MPVDAERFKRALATWASGVTIVTSRAGKRTLGLTLSAFSSVSLDPPLVLVCVDRSASTLELIEASKVFSVSLLSEGQEELSTRFADKAQEAVRFEGLVCPEGVTGCPRIPGAATYLDCRVVNVLDVGDHVVYIGQVEAVETSDRCPLVYQQGRYRTLA